MTWHTTRGSDQVTGVPTVSSVKSIMMLVHITFSGTIDVLLPQRVLCNILLWKWLVTVLLWKMQLDLAQATPKMNHYPSPISLTRQSTRIPCQPTMLIPSSCAIVSDNDGWIQCMEIYPINSCKTQNTPKIFDVNKTAFSLCLEGKFYYLLTGTFHSGRNNYSFYLRKFAQQRERSSCLIRC